MVTWLVLQRFARELEVAKVEMGETLVAIYSLLLMRCLEISIFHNIYFRSGKREPANSRHIKIGAVVKVRFRIPDTSTMGRFYITWRDFTAFKSEEGEIRI